MGFRLNDDTILALGGFCKELLGAEAFQALVSLYEQQCASDLMRTQPHEAKKREQMYASYRGFEDFLGLTRDFANAFDKLATQDNNPVDAPDQEEDYDDPSVHDIYDGH